MISEENYIKLKINGLLDWETLSKEYKISKEEVIRFHNQYCETGEILPLHLPKYVPFLYFPRKNFETRNSSLIQSNSLQYPVGKSEKKYGIVIKYLHRNTRIHYEMHVKRDGTEVEIDKGKSFIGNVEVENTVEKLLEKAGQVMYPLKITVDKKGGISGIENEKEIRERWEKNYLPQMKEYYVGETAEKILMKLDFAFKNLNLRKDYFFRSIFYKLFFLPVYQMYGNFTKHENLDFYFAGINRNISYDVDYLLAKEYTRGAKIALQITGTEQNNENSERGTLDWLYKFRKDTHELFSVEGFISTFEKGKELKIEIQIAEI